MTTDDEGVGSEADRVDSWSPAVGSKHVRIHARAEFYVSLLSDSYDYFIALFPQLDNRTVQSLPVREVNLMLNRVGSCGYWFPQQLSPANSKCVQYSARTKCGSGLWQST